MPSSSLSRRPMHRGVMRDWLATAASVRPGHPYLIDSHRAYSFVEVEERVAIAAGGLLDRDIRPGDRVAVWAENTVDSVVAMLAVPRARAVLIPVNTRHTVTEVRAWLDRVEAVMMVGGPDVPGEPPTQAPGSLVGAPVTAGDLEASTIHSIVPTSGSSGTPKAVRLTWGNLEASAAASALHLDHGPGDRWLCVLPLFHVGGFSILVRSARQMATVRLEDGFDPVRVAGILRRGEVTLASLVAQGLLRVLDSEAGPYRDVRAVLVGGGRIPSGLLERAAGAGLPVLPTYGLTETASQVATLPVAEGLRPRYRVVALPSAEIQVDGGRIRVRGPMVSPGYLGEPDRAPDDWFDTGDLGEIEPDGSLQVLGRADDVVVTGGENVDPAEVEAVIRAHPGVDDVLVVGVDDPVWGQRLVAALVGRAVPEAVERHLRNRLAGYKVPKQWLALDRLPRLPNDKVDRRRLVEMAVDDLNRDQGGDAVV